MPFATVNNHRIHYVDTKDQAPERGRGRLPIVMIHGLGSSQNYYMPVIPLLGDYRCIALDTYGAARSRSQGEDLTLEQLANDIIGLMDVLETSKAVIAGHSMGGPMVLTAAVLHPQRVAGVVAIGPVKPGAVPVEVFSSRIDTVNKEGMQPLADTIPQAATNQKSTSLQKALIRELLLGQDPRGYASHCRVIINMQAPQGGFAAVKCAVLILAGDEDRSAPMTGCQSILDELTYERKELKVLRNVGHWHCIEAPERVAEEISAFVGTL